MSAELTKKFACMDIGEQIAERAKWVAKGADKSPRIVTEALYKIGASFRQGDIVVSPVPESHPKGKRIESRKMAEGTSKGANHVLEGDVEVYEGEKLPPHIEAELVRVLGGQVRDPKIVTGPCFRVNKAGATMTHPDHAHQIYNAGDWFQVSYQVDLKNLQRMID